MTFYIFAGHLPVPLSLIVDDTYTFALTLFSINCIGGGGGGAIVFSCIEKSMWFSVGFYLELLI